MSSYLLESDSPKMFNKMQSDTFWKCYFFKMYSQSDPIGIMHQSIKNQTNSKWFNRTETTRNIPGVLTLNRNNDISLCIFLYSLPPFHPNARANEHTQKVPNVSSQAIQYRFCNPIYPVYSPGSD